MTLVSVYPGRLLLELTDCREIYIPNARCMSNCREREIIAAWNELTWPVLGNDCLT